MTKNLKFMLILALVMLVSQNLLFSQPKTSYSRGEMMLANSTSRIGYLWITNTIEAGQMVYFKDSEQSMVEKYKPSDIISIRISEGQQHYRSESIDLEGTDGKALLQVFFQGEYDLLAYYSPKLIQFFVIDPGGEFIPLDNSFNSPDRGNNYTLQFSREYRKILKELFGINDKINKKIDAAQFTSEDLSEILERYHKEKGLKYEIFFPRLVSSFYAGAGPSLSFLSQSSEINSGISSSNFFGGIRANAGIRFFEGKVDLVVFTDISFGIIQHDFKIENSQELWSYYDEIIKSSIFSPGIEINLVPVNFGNLSPVISGGIQLNTFATSKRTITEELYYPLDGLVLSNYLDDFPKPDPFFGASFGGGLEYWKRNNSFLLSYRFTIFQDNSFGAENCHSVSVMIKRSF